MFEFIKQTQPIAFYTIVKRSEDKFIKRLAEQIKAKGIIEILRKGIKDLDLQINLYYKNPVFYLNQKAQDNYQANIFLVTRQLFYNLSNSKCTSQTKETTCLSAAFIVKP